MCDTMRSVRVEIQDTTWPLLERQKTAGKGDRLPKRQIDPSRTRAWRQMWQNDAVLRGQSARRNPMNEDLAQVMATAVARAESGGRDGEGHALYHLVL